MNIFALAVVVLFSAAAVPEFVNGNTAKGVFYLLSAAININVIFMR